MGSDSFVVLVVDDEPVLRLILRDNLEMSGYPVEEAEDGQQAWEMLNATPDRYGTIVLDRMMPRLDGLGLLKKVKADERLQFIPVILQTALGKQNEILEGLQAGAYYYLIKPYDNEVLASVVDTALCDFQRHHLVLEQVNLGLSSLNLMRHAEYAIQTPQQARTLAASLSHAFPHPARAAMGLVELLLNAVEHGNLEIGYELKSRLQAEDRWEEEVVSRLGDPAYTDREVTVRLTRTASALQIEIQDQGRGFNWQDYLELSTERTGDTHGRGIAMTKALSFDSLEYLGKGNQVKVSVKLT